MTPRPAAVAGERHGLIVLACALLPIATIPLEVGVGPRSLGAPLLVLFLVIAVANAKDFPRGFGVVETLLTALLVWTVARNTIGALAAGEPLDVGFAVREALLLAACIAVFRLGQVTRLHAAIYRGMVMALWISVGFELYQLAVGLPGLQAAGYTVDNGFHYATFEGAFRPFGTFSGPTTFGTFIAMIGGFVALSARTTRGRWAAWAATLGGVVATQTRAAMIGVAIALLILALSSARVRRGLSTAAVPGGLALAAFLMLRPDVWGELTGRLLSATEQSDTSRVTRLDLWGGVVQATIDHDVLLGGFGATSWIAIMPAQVGGIASLGHAHSNFFQEWYRYGLVGAGLFAAVVVALLIRSLNSQREGGRFAAAGLLVAVVFLFDSIFNNSLSSVNFTLTAFLLIGVGVSARTSEEVPGVDAVADEPEGAVGGVDRLRGRAFDRVGARPIDRDVERRAAP